jgi:hypothetical protein
MGDREDMVEMLAEAEKLVAGGKIEWEAVDVRDDASAYYTTEAFKGHTGSWVFTVVSFDIESQGFPKGSRGHDGAAAYAGTILRLPRGLAEQAFKQAKKAVETS